jgi:hypothetical protein
MAEAVTGSKILPQSEETRFMVIRVVVTSVLLLKIWKMQLACFLVGINSPAPPDRAPGFENNIQWSGGDF